jgi:hypothetical protein
MYETFLLEICAVHLYCFLLFMFLWLCVSYHHRLADLDDVYTFVAHAMPRGAQASEHKATHARHAVLVVFVFCVLCSLCCVRCVFRRQPVSSCRVWIHWDWPLSSNLRLTLT